MTQNFKAPKLRFPGFTEDWEQRKLEESFDFLQNNTLSRAELGDSGTALNVHYGDILVKFGDCIDVSLNELPHITNQSSVEKLKNSYLKDGDVVMADTAEDETVGKCSELTDIKDKIVLSGLHTIPLRPKNKFGKGYLGYYLNSGSYHDQLKPLMQGIKVTSISKSALKNTIVSFPRDVSEQEKIGNFFIRIDNLITLHQRKFETLKKLKKGFLQKMFPKNGESVPEIRWEQRKVSEITTSYSGGTPKSGTAEYYDGNIPFIRSGEIYSNKTELFITELGLNNSSAKMVHVGDILYALYGATSGEVSRAKLDGAINQAILAVLPNEEINADFLVEWFRKEKENIIATYLQGGQGNLSAQIIKDLMVDIPSSGEQKKIGDYFTNLNNLITLHQRKLDILKKLKQGMLQQMFI